MLCSGRWHWCIQILISITLFVHRSPRLHSWIDDLILHIHVCSQISRRFWLMEIKWFGLSDLNLFFLHFELGHEFFLKLTEVRYRSGSRRLE